MKGNRLDRVNHLMQMELSRLVLYRLKDPRLGFVTITQVDVAPDLRTARVFYSVMGDQAKKKSSQIALEKAAGFLQKEISAAIEIRYTPKLHFVLDESIEKGFEIDRLIHKIHEKDKPEGGESPNV